MRQLVPSPFELTKKKPQPTANSGICGGDTLFLIANPPPAPEGIVYTFKWFDPNGILISQEENPKIPNISASKAGAYRVEVEGITNCVSSEIVQVVIEELPLRPQIDTDESICIDQTIALQTNTAPNSSDVIYRWFEGLPPAGTLLQENHRTFPEPGRPPSNRPKRFLPGH